MSSRKESEKSGCGNVATAILFAIIALAGEAAMAYLAFWVLWDTVSPEDRVWVGLAFLVLSFIFLGLVTSSKERH